VCHHGTRATSGHYTAVVQHGKTSDGKIKWRVYDDEDVLDLPASQTDAVPNLISQLGYMLFYTYKEKEK
jgi:uncharacterized UBP type Zn finger protein